MGELLDVAGRYSKAVKNHDEHCPECQIVSTDLNCPLYQNWLRDEEDAWSAYLNNKEKAKIDDLEHFLRKAVRLTELRQEHIENCSACNRKL